MNQDIISLARQVGYPIQHPEWQKATEEFSALVAAATREKCAQELEEDASHYVSDGVVGHIIRRCAERTRARGRA